MGGCSIIGCKSRSEKANNKISFHSSSIMEVSQPSFTTGLSWEFCPQEVLWIIFKHSSFKTLLTCMSVNRRWNDIVIDYIEYHSLWPMVFLETTNKGRTFKRKSLLDYRDLLMNTHLWRYLPLAKIKLRLKYILENVSKIQVFQDVLVVMADGQTDTLLRYLDITNLDVLFHNDDNGRLIDFRENEYMLVKLDNTFRAFGKQVPREEANKYLMYVMNDIHLFRLQDNVCYIVTNMNMIWALTWDGVDWDLKCRGRYYSNAYDTISDLNVYSNRVCLVTKLGFIYCEEPKTRAYRKVNSHNIVARLEDSSVLVLFSRKGVAVSVPFSDRRITTVQDINSKVIWLECHEMSCATEHGNILFIGFRDGTVIICTPRTMPSTNGKVDRIFNVLDFDPTVEEPTILGLEVFEDKMSHRLFIATRHRVIQLLITYPKRIRQYYGYE